MLFLFYLQGWFAAQEDGDLTELIAEVARLKERVGSLEGGFS